MDELAVFQGASYFRMLGKGSRYGQSARGLAINCGEGEEFPLFTDFWLGKPQPGAAELRLYRHPRQPQLRRRLSIHASAGRLDLAATSRPCVFFRPEEVVKASYDAEKIPYAGLKTVGLAPLTSMFWFGENTEGKPDDYRGEVHDSDGLLIQMENDEFVWRPLINPPSQGSDPPQRLRSEEPKALRPAPARQGLPQLPRGQ